MAKICTFMLKKNYRAKWLQIGSLEQVDGRQNVADVSHLLINNLLQVSDFCLSLKIRVLFEMIQQLDQLDILALTAHFP